MAWKGPFQPKLFYEISRSCSEVACFGAVLFPCAGAHVPGLLTAGVSPFIKAISMSIHGWKLPEWELCLQDALTCLKSAGSLAAELAGAWSSLEDSPSSPSRADLQSCVDIW